jgi:DNA-binding GntR family transcriptional regulator
VVDAVTDEIAAVLAADRLELAASSTAERVAGILRTRIMEGLFAPGSRLSEEVLGRALGVSRNTLREAFRLLCHERLTVHEMNRGIFVPVLTKADVVDLYRLRRLLEGGAARMAASAPVPARLAVSAAVEDAEAAVERGAWLEVRTADLHFHQAIGRLAQSPRIDELMSRALAELRLAFHAMTDPEQFHRPYVERNRLIAGLVNAGRGREAERELRAYLTDAEGQLLAAYEHPNGAVGADGTVAGGGSAVAGTAVAGTVVPGGSAVAGTASGGAAVAGTVVPGGAVASGGTVDYPAPGGPVRRP